MNPTLIKSLDAAAAVEGRTLVVLSAAGTVSTATAKTVGILGVSEQIGSRPNGKVDVIMSGIALVELGGTVAQNDYITASATGKGVEAADDEKYVGMAMESGVVGDYIKVDIRKN